MKNFGLILTGLIVVLFCTTFIAHADDVKKRLVQPLDSNEVPAMLVGNPNMLQEQADTIMLTTGEVVHRWDDSDRNNTCYLTPIGSISCVPKDNRRR